MYTLGTFYCAATVNRSFFSENAQADREQTLTSKDTPFLYKIIMGMLLNSTTPITTSPAKCGPTDTLLGNKDNMDHDFNESGSEDESSPLQREEINYFPVEGVSNTLDVRYHWVSTG